MTDDAVLDGQRWLWSIGDYPAIARHLHAISVATVDALPIEAGTRVLDVGTGDGNAAVVAARRGAVVTGVDLTPAQLELAGARATAEGLDLDLQEANAEDLPFPDASFDVVVSVLGMIFAPDHEQAAAEMVRVCRPGGTVAVVSWADVDGSWFRGWRQRAEGLTPEPIAGGPRPDEWGDAAEMERRLRAAGLTVQVEPRSFHWEFPSVEASIAFFVENAGPFIAFMQAAESAGRGDEARAALVDALHDANESEIGLRVASPWLLAVGTRATP